MTAAKNLTPQPPSLERKGEPIPEAGAPSLLRGGVGEARRELFQGGAGGFNAEKQDEVNTKVDKMSMAAMKQIEEALTDDQKKTWKTTAGEPFDVSKLRPRTRRID